MIPNAAVQPFKVDRPVVERAVEAAGTFIESVGKTDLIDYSPDEFDTLLVRAILGAYPQDDLTSDQGIAGICEARNAAGAYLEGLPTTDMMAFSPSIFRTLCGRILDGYLDGVVPF